MTLYGPRVRRGGVIFCAAALLLCGSAGEAARVAGQGGGAASRLNAILRRPGLRGARVSALAVRARDGREVFRHDPDRDLVPASNMKVLTAIGALAVFGPAHRFATTVSADRRPDLRGEVGALVVRGGGDPALTSEEWWRLAADLRRQGLRSVRGDLWLDDRRFDRPYWHPAWGRITPRAYHAPIGALTANYSTFAVEVQGGPRKGGKVRVGIDPPVSYLQVRNEASTGGRRSRVTLRIQRKKRGEREVVRVLGQLRAGAPAVVKYRNVLDPTRYAGAVFRLQLEANGINVGGRIQRGRAPRDWPTLLVYHGKALAEIVRLMLKYSNNFIAESLVKAMGARASGGSGNWKNGMAALRAALADAGVPLRGAVLVDGSGLGRGNRLSARVLVAALRLARRSFRFGPEFISALPIAGSDGTLTHRVRAGPNQVRAKTGLLDRVTALSGYARTADGDEVVFSILANGFRKGAGPAMRVLDDFAAELTRMRVSRDAAISRH